jgi:sulfite reductase (ferredoxin)
LYDQSPELLPVLDPVSFEQVVLNAKDARFQTWLTTNVFEQKQEGYVGVFLKVQLGNFNTDQARELANIMDRYAADDARFTIDQSVLLKFILPSQLETLYTDLKAIHLADTGYNSVADVTACPGTDTCNLGISNSTEAARVIEQVIREEYPELLFNKEIKIKISGCMNSCGQHGLAHIGFHGSSIKVGQATAPALQLLLGGGNIGNGSGRIAEKVIKFPSKRVLMVVRALLDDYQRNQLDEEWFNAYYDRLGNKYFYDLLKPLAETTTLEPTDFIDWGSDVNFKTAIGIGECAGVVIDLVSTLLFDAQEKQVAAQEALEENRWADAVYHAYAAAIHAAKALLLRQNVRCNTHQGIIADFDEHLAASFQSLSGTTFSERVLCIREQQADEVFTTAYLTTIDAFLKEAIQHQQN